MLFCISKTKNNELAHTEKPSPLVGDGFNRQGDGRGKCEQNRKNQFLRTTGHTALKMKNKEEKARFRGLFLFACFISGRNPSFLKGIGVQKIWNNEQLYMHKYSNNVFLIYWNKC